jgi:hypothetical protein
VETAERVTASEAAPEPEPLAAAPAAAGFAPTRRLTPAGVLYLQRTAGNGAVARLLSVARVPDQHKDTHLPTADELAKIDVQVNPTAPAVKGAVAPKWDGDPSVKDFNNNRAALKAELTAALKKHLDTALPNLKALDAGPKLSMTAFEGPGRAAKRVTDAKFGAYASAAALTAPQVHARSIFAFKSGTQLLDRTKPADFTPDPADVASWIAQTDTLASAAQKRHHLNKDRSPLEDNWLSDEVLKPFVASRKADLALYDIYGFASSGDTILIAPTITASKGFSADVPKGGGPSRAERRERWSTWETLVHEYIHTLEHPAFLAMRGGNRILFEGFCEMFTEEVLREWIPKAQADSDATLRGEVEGVDGGGKPWPDFTPDLVRDYSAGEYADYAKRAKEIRNVLGVGGENAVRAAFFQGHFELIGLGSSGKVAAAPAGPAAPAGMRFHQVVASPGVRGPLDAVVETADQIATQNGVTTAELTAANPGLDFSKLKAGDVVLIPVKP